MKFPKFKKVKNRRENLNNVIILYDKAIDSLDNVLSFLKEIKQEYGRFFQLFVGEPLHYINKNLEKVINNIEHKKWRIEKKLEKNNNKKDNEIELGK